MAYKCEEQLKLKANGFLKKLKEEGIDGEIKQIGDYLIRLEIIAEGESCGYVNLYYSPKKDEYTLKTNQLEQKSITKRILIVWDCANLSSKPTGEEEYKIYVDGSYLDGNIGYGLVVLKGDKVVDELSGYVSDPDAQDSRQVGGELVATQEAVRWCQQRGIKRVAIYYDLENIKKWATGEYKTNKPLTQNFKDFMDSVNIEINWHKVKAHTGVKWNERADELAKAGAASQESTNNNSLVDELDKKAKEFSDYLQRRGYSVDYKGIYNLQAAKLGLDDGFQNIGHLNIYNTKKLHLVPKYHELRDKFRQDELEKLWQEFLTIKS
ncbi:ribonuclease HI [Orenia metallireducens]|uniref:Ribonuclease HI n=1 Tax=Orenia metallireducens TaxID=1413210 RepID=A0A285F2P2_9FIRM|nr:RNase H family protein [Orenia metallireducens]PRX34770.1 ribonuclease HI [Orenia metallireducens]SNY05558.1 Ribonuclease HI [Orenia metallireducens]